MYIVLPGLCTCFDFTNDTYMVSEGDEVVEICITLTTSVETNESIVVGFFTEDGDKAEGTYVHTNVCIHFVKSFICIYYLANNVNFIVTYFATACILVTHVRMCMYMYGNTNYFGISI